MVADSRSRLELTIPRLELLAAHLLSQLMSTTAASLKIPEEGIYILLDRLSDRASVVKEAT